MCSTQTRNTQCVQAAVAGAVSSAEGLEPLTEAPPQAFVSIALDYYPPDPSNDSESTQWVRDPGQINAELLEQSPTPLQAVVRAAFFLSIACLLYTSPSPRD